MTRDDLLALAERVEVYEPSFDLWVKAVDLLHRHDASRFRNLFNDFMRVGAYLDAADMLRPPKHHVWVIRLESGGCSVSIGPTPKIVDCFEGHARGIAFDPHAEARARLAANLRAHAAEKTT